MNHPFTRRLLMTGTLAVALAAPLFVLAVPPVFAHEAKCPVCKLDVVQDTDKLDHEVALRSGRKRIEYRCVNCALTDAGSYKGDLTILAPSELKGKPVVLVRKDNRWTVTPESAVFVGHKVNHQNCELGYRALTNRGAFDKWIHTNAELLKDAKPLTLAEMLELAGAAK